MGEIERLNASWKSAEKWKILGEQEWRVAVEQRAIRQAEERKVKTVHLSGEKDIPSSYER